MVVKCVIMIAMVCNIMGDEGQIGIIKFLDPSGRLLQCNLGEMEASLLVILGSPCVSCNKNVPIWNRLSKLMPNENSFGIIKVKFDSVEKVLRFPLLQLQDGESLSSLCQLRDGVDYTIILKRGHLVYLQFGLLTPLDYEEIKRMVNEFSLAWKR